MKIIFELFDELLGLFVDDRGLAGSIVCVVAVAAALRFWIHASSSLVGGVVGLGTLMALIISTLRGR